jgi:hypothetical protein
MAILVIEYRVEDYGWWKGVFDQDPLQRKARGGTGHWIHRDPTDANHFLFGMTFGSVAEAESFRDLPAFQQVWEASGAGQSWVLEEAEAIAYVDKR